MEFLNAFSHLDWAQVLHLTWQHITLVGIAVILAIFIGVPLGILMTRFPTLAGPLQASASVLLTVPSIALKAVSPLLPAIGTPGDCATLSCSMRNTASVVVKRLFIQSDFRPSS